METFHLKPKNNWAKKTGTLLLESIGIILSIIIAFGIENWDEEQKKTEKEIFYLQSVYTDLLKDYRELDRRIFEYDEKLKSTESLLLDLQENKCNAHKIFNTINSKLTYNFSYVPFNHTYKALESSGDIKLIKNDQLKLLLFELDKSFYTTTLYGDNFLNYTHSLMWAGFLLGIIDYQNQDFKENTLSDKDTKITFYNKTNRLYELLQTYYYNMQGTHLKIKEVKEKLEFELESRNIQFEKVNFESKSDIQNKQNEEDELENLL